MGLVLRIAVAVSLVIASVATAALLTYSSVLVLRFWSGGVGRRGGDTIAIAYICAAAGLLGSSLAFFGTRSRATRRIGAVVLSLAVAATAFWLILHLGDFVYSHESAMPDYDPG